MCYEAFSSRGGCVLPSLLHTAALLLFLLLLLLPPSHTLASNSLDPNDHPETVKGVVGGSAMIPCLVRASEKDNLDALIWNKKIGRKDIRVFTLSQASGETQQMVSEEVFGARADFILENGLPFLRVVDLQVRDAGYYTCNVHYSRKRVQTADATLKIIVPPGEPAILGEDGTEVYTEFGPYNEGAFVNLTCQVKGGQPSPRVSWYQKERLLDEESERRENEVVRNTLRLGPLTREDLGKKYLCQAYNSELVGPRSKEVTLKMYLKPLAVKMQPPSQPLVAGSDYNFTCESYGGLPPAHITWWLLGKMINPKMISSETQGNTSRSTLKLRAEVKHNEETIRCNAESPKIDHEALDDKWTLEVQYAPEVKLQVGQGLDIRNVREGDDVILVCRVNANPKATSITWYHKVMEVNYNDSAGIIRRGNDLHLRKVTRHQSGSYTCHASNEIGMGKSDPIVLNVMYVPFCKEKTTISRGAAKQDNVELECNVRGSPDNITFSWYFVSNGDRVPISRHNYTRNDLTSILTYRVQDDNDYGTVECYGKNMIGIMEDPCVFQVTPAGKPDPLDNCTVYNKSSDTLFVSCLPGYDGGLDQHFVLQVYEVLETIRPSILNFTATSEPSFMVNNLQPGTEYLLSMYAENPKGKSEERKTYGFTLPALGRPVVTFPITPVLGVLIGVVGALVLVAVVVLVVMKLRGDSRRERILRHVAAEGVKLPISPQQLPPKDDGTYENVDNIPSKLKHANIYETVPYDKEKSSSNNEDSEKDDVEYAELTFNNGKNKSKNNKRTGGSGAGGANGVIRTADDTTIYATIDHARTEAQQQQQKKQQRQQKQQKQPAPIPPKPYQGKQQKKQVYIAQAGSKSGKSSPEDTQPPREADEIPLMDAALESSV